MTEFAPPTDPATFVPDRFAGQGMLVTGAAGGMGLARATHAAREGAAMVLANIPSREHCARMVEAAVEAFGGLDIAIKNAGVIDGGSDGRRPCTSRTIPAFAAPSRST